MCKKKSIRLIKPKISTLHGSKFSYTGIDLKILDKFLPTQDNTPSCYRHPKGIGWNFPANLEEEDWETM